ADDRGVARALLEPFALGAAGRVAAREHRDLVAARRQCAGEPVDVLLDAADALRRQTVAQQEDAHQRTPSTSRRALHKDALIYVEKLCGEALFVRAAAVASRRSWVCRWRRWSDRRLRLCKTFHNWRSAGACTRPSWRVSLDRIRIRG